jgi:hypothetical protein
VPRGDKLANTQLIALRNNDTWLLSEETAMQLRSMYYNLMASWHSPSKWVRRRAESRFESSQTSLRIWRKFGLHVRENAVTKTSCNAKVFHGVGMGCIRVTYS